MGLFNNENEYIKLTQNYFDPCKHIENEINYPTSGSIIESKRGLNHFSDILIESNPDFWYNNTIERGLVRDIVCVHLPINDLLTIIMDYIHNFQFVYNCDKTHIYFLIPVFFTFHNFYFFMHYGSFQCYTNDIILCGGSNWEHICDGCNEKPGYNELSLNDLLKHSPDCLKLFNFYSHG